MVFTSVFLIDPVFAADDADQSCPQVITCGDKEGKAKEYPTPCDARKDSATNIRPRQGESCPAMH
jgi:hypothetical protein